MFRSPFSLIFIISLCVLFSSCQHPEEPEDTTPPEISVTSPIVNKSVKGIITIDAKVEETGTGFSMQIFLDGNLLKTSSSGQISAELDTRTLSEGVHTIKITATDNAGNTSERTFTITVRNILFKLHVSSNYVPEFTRIHFALSRNDGSLIAIQEIENGGSMSVPTPADFNLDSTFVFTEYFYQAMEGFKVNTLNVYAGLNAGEFFLPEYPIGPAYTGSHHVKVTEVPTEVYNAHFIGRNAIGPYGFFGFDGVIETDVYMWSNTSDLLFSLTLGTEPPVYKYFNNIEAGGSTEFSLTGLAQMPKVGVTTTDGTGSYYYFLNPDNSDLLSLYPVEGNFEDGKIPVYYPGTSYPQYRFNLTYQVGGNYYFNYLRSATPPPAFQYLNAAMSNVNYANRKLRFTSTGTYDIGSISGNSSDFDGTTFSLVLNSVNFPYGTNKVTLLNTPAEMLSLGFAPSADLIFTSAGFNDFIALSGESDYQNKIVFSSDLLARQYRDQVGYGFQLTSGGGRLTLQKKAKLPKQLETLVRSRFNFPIR